MSSYVGGLFAISHTFNTQTWLLIFFQNLPKDIKFSQSVIRTVLKDSFPCNSYEYNVVSKITLHRLKLFLFCCLLKINVWSCCYVVYVYYSLAYCTLYKPYFSSARATAYWLCYGKGFKEQKRSGFFLVVFFCPRTTRLTCSSYSFF